MASRQCRNAGAVLSVLAILTAGCAGAGDSDRTPLADGVGAASAAPPQNTSLDDPPAVPPVAVPPTAPGSSGRITVFLSDGQSCRAQTPATRASEQLNDSAPAAAVEALLAGPTAGERARGLDYFGSPDVALLRAVRVRAGTAYVDLTRSFLSLNNVSTACGSEVFRSGVQNTLRQAAGVTTVRYAVEGSRSTFYEHMQLSCPATAPGAAASEDGCDAAPFR